MIQKKQDQFQFTFGLIVDACRSVNRQPDMNDLFLRPSRNSFIWYSCALDQAASDGDSESNNGAFTGILLKHLRTREEWDLIVLARKVAKDVSQNSYRYQLPWWLESMEYAVKI